MEPVEQFPIDTEARIGTFAKHQPQYADLPALVYPDGLVLTEWTFSEGERAAIARGENLRLWIHTYGRPLQPVKLEITDERKG